MKILLSCTTHHDGNPDHTDENEESVDGGEDVPLVVGDGGEEGEEGAAKEEDEQGGDGCHSTREDYSSSHCSLNLFGKLELQT